jgi:hypothetical protein
MWAVMQRNRRGMGPGRRAVMKTRMGVATGLLLAAVLLVLGSCRTYQSNSSDEELARLLDRAIIEDGIYYLLPEQRGDSERALIFYPGGLVSPVAYLPLLAEITDTAGIPTILIPMPLNLAVLAPNRAVKFFAEFPQFLVTVDHWYIGGHSLGGAMAAGLIEEYPERFAGLLLLASYPAQSKDLSDFELPVMSISAEYDTVASSDEIMESKKRLPEQTRFEVISGGNHAGFGDYGPQSGDGEAAISKQQQWQRTAELFTQWLQQWE